jgi:hypothetical protein
MDLFSTEAVELIDEDSDLYKNIELGFIKFDIDLLNLKVNNEPTINTDTTNSGENSSKRGFDSFKEKFL